MKIFRSIFGLAILGMAVLGLAQGAQGQEDKPPTATTKRVWLPKQQHFAHLTHINKLRSNQNRGPKMFDPSKLKAPALPIDWAKSLSFPMDLNDTYGDCYYAAGCHADNTWSGNAGVESTFSLSAIKTRYFSLSGGDNGLDDSDMQGEMKNHGLADVPDAKIVDYLYLDTTNPAAVQAGIYNFGCVIFTFAVPDSWINNSSTGAIWDAPATADPNNGHAVIFNGVDTAGKYKLQTWGSYVWITPSGVTSCMPGGWVAFTKRWFDAKGMAPNGQHITQLAKAWTDAGGKTIPADVINAFPPIGPTPAPPNPNPPGPTPGPGVLLRSVAETYSDGSTKLYNVVPANMEAVPVGTQQKVQELIDLFKAPKPKVDVKPMDPAKKIVPGSSMRPSDDGKPCLNPTGCKCGCVATGNCNCKDCDHPQLTAPAPGASLPTPARRPMSRPREVGHASKP